jgi:hypothetical protein
MRIRMRITLDLDDALVHGAQQKAARRGVTLSRVVEDALRASLAPSEFRLDLPVGRGQRPPAVDVRDRDALWDAMETDADQR